MSKDSLDNQVVLIKEDMVKNKVQFDSRVMELEALSKQEIAASGILLKNETVASLQVAN
jgi:hypothetical protein